MNPKVLFTVTLLLLALVQHIKSSSSSQCDLTTSSTTTTTLQCSLRTLQSSIDASDKEVDSAKVLNLKCSDMFFHESHLKSDHFGSLPNLEKLSIDFCKIRNVPARAFAGLANLKSLRLESHNADWSSVLMDIDMDSFKRLSALENLALAHNNLWSVPPGLLCGLDNLKSLNLSSNHLLEVSNVGLSAGSSSCQAFLTSLDLSNNVISSVNGDDLKQAPSMEVLNLSNNRITILSDDAFSGLAGLKEVDLSNNQLAALPPNVFNKSHQLEKLFLQNNSLTLITSDLFSSLSQLKVLNLSRNSISSHLISVQTFSGLTGLVTLDLSFNKLSKIDNEIFSKLASLEQIILHNNQIHRIDTNSLTSLVNLKVLDLSHNKLTTMSASLPRLTSLRLDNNKIQDLSNVTFKCEQLVELFLQENLLSAVPDFVNECQNLKMLDLANNKMKIIEDGAFSGLANLYGLSLAGNQLIKLTNETFTGISAGLNMLNVARNNLEVIERAAFQDMKELRALRLDNNNLNDLNGLVSHLSNLNWLNASSNNLEWFDYAFIPNSLVWLDVSYNKINDLGNFYSLTNFGLQTLEAGHNMITKLDQASFLESLIHVRLDNNLIEEITHNAFVQLTNLQMVDLQTNKIQHLSMDSIATSDKNVSGRPRVYLSDNPFTCDCHLAWLPSINDDSHKNVAVVADLSELICINDDEGESIEEPVKASLVIDMAEEDFLCKYETHCFSSCMCCDFYACDCRMQCPFGCECKHDADWTLNIVTCSSNNHSHVPILIPMDATSLHLDGNNLQHVDQQNFLGRHRVKKLFLNNSNVATISDNAFSGLTDLRELHLNHNDIAELHGYEFSGLIHLRELYLQNNVLAYINDITFQQLHSLEVLQLDGNLLTVFPVWKLASNPLLTSLTLSQNLWSCECDFVTPFNDFLETRIKTIVDYEEINCVSDNIIQKGDWGLEPCPSKSVVAANSNSDEEQAPKLGLATILVPACVAVVMIILGFLAVCVFRKNIKNWLYSKSTSPVYDSSVEPYSSSSGGSCNSGANSSVRNKLFDVYVTYSGMEADFVHHTLAPTLENGSGTNYRLCLQRRDFPVSAPVYDTVSVAADSSERVLMVLTESYLLSEWPVTKGPLSGVLFNNEAYKDKLVILLISDISNDLLYRHPDLCHYLRSCPIVRWGAPGYLNQLRFFLPEPALLTFQRNITLRSMHPPPPLAPKNKQQCSIEHIHGNANVPMFTPTGTDFSSVYNSRGSDHTYHSIPDHIYHTLEPSSLLENKFGPVRSGRTMPPAPSLSPFNKNLDLVLRLESPATSPNLPPACHSYTHSTSSGQQLLSSNETEEYIV